MEQEKFNKWMMEYLSDVLDKTGRTDFEKFLRDNPEFIKQFEDLGQTWSKTDNLKCPESSKSMDVRFYDMLHDEIQKSEIPDKNKKSWFFNLLEILWSPQVAYGLVLVCLGFGLGYFFNSNTILGKVETTIVSNLEAKVLREKLALTLLTQPSANQRLQGINEVNKIIKIDEKIIKALLQTLNYDSNVNVRLAAIESLTNYLDKPVVREGLVLSIVKQDSPIIQVTLANLMVALQEKKSIAPFKALIRSKGLNKAVKQKLEISIQSIL